MIRKSIIVGTICAICLIAAFVFIGCSGGVKADISAESAKMGYVAPGTSGDSVEKKDLLGVWKLVSFECSGEPVTGDSALAEDKQARYWAYYWLDFSETDVTFTAIPEKGDPSFSLTASYEIKDKRITFSSDADELLLASAKMLDGKLVLSRDVSDDEDGSKVAICTFKKQS